MSTQAQSPSKASVTPQAGLAEFVQISELLLDQRPLPMDAARAFMDIVLRATPSRYAPGDIYEDAERFPGSDPHPFDVLWAVFQQLAHSGAADLEARFMALTLADVTLNALVHNMLIVWYNGYLGTDMPSAEVYAAALVWPAIGARPPGMPGPYYGNWAYPPEQPVAQALGVPQATSALLSRHADAKPRR